MKTIFYVLAGLFILYHTINIIGLIWMLISTPKLTTYIPKCLEKKYFDGN